LSNGTMIVSILYDFQLKNKDNDIDILINADNFMHMLKCVKLNKTGIVLKIKFFQPNLQKVHHCPFQVCKYIVASAQPTHPWYVFYQKTDKGPLG